MTTPQPLRLGIEPGYDGGMVGAWLLDLPGAFGWARNREAAISQSASVAGWWRDWLEQHDETWSLGALGSTEVTEDVAATVLDDGYERNATFARDRRPVTGDELEAALRRLGYARQDLLTTIAQLGGIERDDGERSGEEVLRHLAAAEIWLGSRLDAGARYPGRTDEPDAGAHLAATRAWAVDNLRRLWAASEAGALARERTDGKGETWTLAKVVRRYVYHSVDHLRELQRRIARADGWADRLRLDTSRLRDVGPLVRLLRSVGWDRRTLDRQRLQRALDGSQAMVGLWDRTELVAFAREIGDGEFNALISMVVVDPRWQGLGLATRLIEVLMGDRAGVRFMLNSAAGLDEFYARFGFERDASAMVRRAG